MKMYRYIDGEKIPSALENKKVCIVGFGAQGKSQALNLRDSKIDVKIGLNDGSKSTQKALELGFEVVSIPEGVKKCDLIMILTPDEVHKEVFQTLILPYLSSGKALAFSHGFSIHYQEVLPPKDIDVIMIAPKAAGSAVREEYEKGRGVISLIAVHQDFSGNAKNIALSYASGLGSHKSAIFESSFREECECDLFSEQSVICGGIDSLIRAGFDTLVEAGYPQEVAYFECLHELKLVADLIYKGGLKYMREHISNTAEYGDITAGEQIINEKSKQAMREILEKIQNGEFAKSFAMEKKNNFDKLKSSRKKLEESKIEITGAKMRELMPWLKE